MQPQLLSINDDVGKGVVGRDGTRKKREGSPLSNLELGIGDSRGLRGVVKEEKDQLVFTAEQLQQLQLQVVIFRYILAGLPVPIDLVLPVWRSLAASLGSSKSGIYDQLPSFLGFTPRDFDYRSMMDAEPGRCRRTDGKKWRCYRDVVPNQKYCERHMHRGCQRSRKHVETSEDDTKANSSAINSDIFASSMKTSNATTTDSRTPAMLSTSLNLTVPCPSISKSVPETLKSSSAPYTGNGNLESKGDNVMTVNNGTSTSSLIRVLADKNNTKYVSNCTDGIGFECSNISTNKIDQSSGGNKKSGDASVVPGFGLSPKSVLQCSTASNCNQLNFDCKTEVEVEPLRCRRTDGKKWRCSRDVVPDKKYCERHLHRGVKKAVAGSKLIIGAPAAPPSHNIQTRGTATKVEKLNTNLSISIAANPQHTSDADSSSFSNSDATTVSDENVTSSHILTLSP
ncbi:growth-regulating factor 9-like isoform X3 [Coffea arabica]